VSAAVGKLRRFGVRSMRSQASCDQIADSDNSQTPEEASCGQKRSYAPSSPNILSDLRLDLAASSPLIIGSRGRLCAQLIDYPRAPIVCFALLSKCRSVAHGSPVRTAAALQWPTPLASTRSRHSPREKAFDFHGRPMKNPQPASASARAKSGFVEH
jgi:hypothetical protein